MNGVRKNSLKLNHMPKLGRKLKQGGVFSTIGTLMLISALVSSVCAYDYDSFNDLEVSEEHQKKWEGCSTCKGEGYTLDLYNFLGHNPSEEDYVPPVSSALTPQQARAAMQASDSNDMALDDYVHGEYLMPAKDVKASDLIVDVGTEYDDLHIKGAIPLYWEELLDDNNEPRHPSEIGEILGDAGISSEDSVVLYGICDTCDGISVSPFVFWAMRYAGHDNVKVLNGGIDAWVALDLPVESTPNSLPNTTYTPSPRPELLASYDQVISGNVQLVDARSLHEYGSNKIGNAIRINPLDVVLRNGQFEDAEDLVDLFARLDEDIPVTVYSNAGARASTVWYALQLIGRESSIYSWNDWADHQYNVLLTDIYADPNPSGPGSIKIYATFDVVEGESSMDAEYVAESIAEDYKTEFQKTEEMVFENDPEKDVIVEVKGCAACFPTHVNLDADESGFIKLSSSDSTSGNAASATAEITSSSTIMTGRTPSSTTAESTSSSGLRLGASSGPTIVAEALVRNQENEVMAHMEMASFSGNQYVGTWNAASAPAGLYTVTLGASAGGSVSYFENVLTVKITDSGEVNEPDTKYQKLGSY